MMNNLWMQPFSQPEIPHLTLYRCNFTTASPVELSIRFSADERAQLFLDGEYLTEGPERGAPEHWYFRELSLTVKPGNHTLSARVSSFPGNLNYGQMSLRHGFFCEESSGLLKNWECRIEQGLTFEEPFPDWGGTPRVHVGPEYGSGEWLPVRLVIDDRVLYAPDLPEMRYQQIVPEEIRPGLLFFSKYTCCWGIWHWHGRGTARVRWTETFYDSAEFDSMSHKGKKGNRNGSVFIGNGDEFEVDGELVWRDFQWHAGHYAEVTVRGDVTWDAEFFETGYPLPGYPGSSPLAAAAVETLRACAHETFMDCPYFERILYAGDSRLEALALYHLSDDHRLAAKTLRMFLLSQRADGSILAQYPSRSVQIIPSFMPIFVLTFHDYWKLHPADPLVRELMPKLRRLVDYLLNNITAEGMTMPGWAFLDWTDNWKGGVPPGNCAFSLLGVLALRAAAEIFAEEELFRRAASLSTLIRKCYYQADMQLFADDVVHSSFSEHAQALAVLAGFHDVKLDAAELVPCSIYFSYYYLCACRELNRQDLIEKRLNRFRQLLKQGLTTLPEEFDQPRSDCHAWGAYILLFLETEAQ